MTLLRPSAVVTLDGTRLTSAEGAVLRVRVRLGMGPAHDDVGVLLGWPSSKLKSAAAWIDAFDRVGLVRGSETDVFTGEVTGVRLTPDGLALEGLAKSIALSRTFVSQTFLDLSIADIVQQLASAAKRTSTARAATARRSRRPTQAVDDRRSAKWASPWNDLAQLVGADVTVTETGAAHSSSSGNALA